MYKKTLGLFLMGTLFFFCSCVDDTYDLNKKISTDMGIIDNKLALPLGSLKAIVLDSLIGGIDIIDTNKEGIYAIKQNDTIHPIEKKVDEILLTIKPQGISSSISTSGYVTGNASGVIPIPFTKSNDFAFENRISKQFKRVESLTFIENMDIELNIKLEGLEALQKSPVHLDLILEFPKCFKDLKCEDENITVLEGNKVQIKKEYLTQNSDGLNIDLYSSALDFKDETNNYQGLRPVELSNGDPHIVYQGKIVADGTLKLDINASESSVMSQIRDIKMDINCNFAPSFAHTFNGLFYDELNRIRNAFGIDLGEKLEALKKDGNHITLAEPQIEVVLYNSISMPTDVQIEIVGKDKEENIIAEITPEEKIAIGSAKYDAALDSIYETQSKLLLTAAPINTPEGYHNLVIPELASLLETVPDSVVLYVQPVVDTLVDSHHIGIYQALSINAAYDIEIPLKFKELEIHYSDTVSAGLGEALEAFGDVSLKLKMDITNTIPVELTLNVSALDAEDRIIEDIKFESVSISKGNGESIHHTNTEKQQISFDLGTNTSNFEKFKIDITAESHDETTGLKSLQGLYISGIVIEAAGNVGSQKVE